MKGRLALVIAALLSTALPLAGASGRTVVYTSDFRLQDCTFSDSGGNPYFSLQPGNRLLLEGEENGEAISVEQLVLDQTLPVTFRTPEGATLTVRTRVVQERESVNGEIAEVSRNYFARCRETNSVFYFGEDVDIYEGGAVVSHAGAWIAGAKGALPGVIMPGMFLLGSRYYQEVAPGVALDRSEHVAMGLTVSVPAGTFDRCVQTLDTNELDPKDPGDVKLYCPGIGIVADGAARLVEFDAGR